MQVVIDTNVVLDLFVFGDAACTSLRTQLDDGTARWIATTAMRDELQRVLAYPHIAMRLAAQALDAEQVLAQFDRRAQIEIAPQAASVTCGDPDDQKFIDLAVAQKCLLLSKDLQVLTLRKRMGAFGATVAAAMPCS